MLILFWTGSAGRWTVRCGGLGRDRDRENIGDVDVNSFIDEEGKMGGGGTRRIYIRAEGTKKNVCAVTVSF